MLIKWTPTAEVNMVKNSRGCYQIRAAADLYRLNSIKTVDPSVGGEVTDPEEETTSIVKPFVAPVAEKANRWYDLSGRRLNKKPSNRGSFYSKQAIVK